MRVKNLRALSAEGLLLAVFSLSQPTKNETGWTLESIPETSLAKSQVASSRAGLSPTVDVGLSGSRGEGGDSTTNTTSSGVKNSVSATLTASWESDLWGEVRRSIESSQATAQQSDALLAGVRLSISSSVASNYFALRQMNIDVRL